MLRIKILSSLLLITFLVVLIGSQPASSNSALRRLTQTWEGSLNLNPAVSDDGNVVVFESTADLGGTGTDRFFHALRANLSNDPLMFEQLGRTRIVAPTINGDGQVIAFSSFEDLLGRNADRNSEIYLQDGSSLTQVTETTPNQETSRLRDGNFQPTISLDGRFLAFSSNRDLPNVASNGHSQILLYDRTNSQIDRLSPNPPDCDYLNPKMSGNGERVFFVRSCVESVGNLMMFEKSSGQVRVLLEGAVGIDLGNGKSVSHDGTRLVYSSRVAENDHEIFIYDVNRSSSRQITQLGARASDVALSPALSGDGKRITFATRRRALTSSDGSVELYLIDIPTGQLSQITSAPSSATAEVSSSLNFDGSKVVFNFPRVLSGPVSSNDFANNSEIYQAKLSTRPPFGALAITNAASKITASDSIAAAAPESIVSIRGGALAFSARQANPASTSLEGTTVTVGGQSATLLYVSASEVIAVLPRNLTSGIAEVVLTNAEGFQSKNSILLARSAPGVFTSSANGTGDAIVVDADKLLLAPFDPSDGRLRLSVFATGCRNALDLKASMAGQPLAVESVVASASLPGLDEVHLLVPDHLRGLGTGTLIITADDIDSNPASITLSGSLLRDIMINEFLADPPDGAAGDANNDGVRDASADEFIELVNATERDMNISGYQLETRGGTSTIDVLRHKFAPDTILQAGTALVVFGGGRPSANDPVFGGSQVVRATTGGLSLNNTAGTITLRDQSSKLVSFLTYGTALGLPANQNQSLTRSPDTTGDFLPHTQASGSNGLLFSPGARADHAPFLAHPPVFRVAVTPEGIELIAGVAAQLTARSFDMNNQELSLVIFRWNSSDTNVARVDQMGRVEAIASGRAEVFAMARGTRSNAAQVIVTAPTPSPTPLPSPVPTPTPTPTPLPIPSPLPTASPSPTPVAIPPVLISEFRTRGPNGANDEFVEIFNNSDSQIALGGWKIRASNSTGTTSTRMTITAGTLLPGRARFLATNASGYSGSVPGDQTYSSGITNDGGIAVTLPDDTIVDQVGLSTGTTFREGMHLVPLTSDLDQSYARKSGTIAGSEQDTNDNSADFRLIAPSAPQNLGSGPNPGPSPIASPTPSTMPTPGMSPLPTPTPSPSPSPSPSARAQIVISQIYGGGGNAGAPFRNDFIELFNSGAVDVSLAGWSVQYASATASTWAVTLMPELSLAPGQYLLIQQSSGGANGIALPSPDATGSTNLAATAGKVALVSSTVAISGACPQTPTIIDLVGYGNTASCFRVAAAPAPANATALLRKENGCTNAENNAGDFVVAAPNPRNSSSARNTCAVASLIADKSVYSHKEIPAIFRRLLCLFL